MKNTTHEQNFKERVISDYLSGGGTYCQLQARYGIGFQLINQCGGTSKVKKSQKTDVMPPQDLPLEVKQLQDELRQGGYTTSCWKPL